MTEEMQAFARVPTIALRDYPMQVHIGISQVGSRYEMVIMTEAETKSVKITTSPAEFGKLTFDLREAAYLVACETEEPDSLQAIQGGQHEFVASPQLQALLKQLATKGHLAYKWVFEDPAALSIIQGLQAVSPNLYIGVDSQDLNLPWDLIYPVSIDRPVSPWHFWGMNHIIYRRRDVVGAGAFVPPRIHVSTRPNVGLVADGDLPAVVAKEIPFFEALNAEERILLFRLPSLDPEKWSDGFEEFMGFWTNSFDLAHLACDVNYVDESPGDSCMVVSDGFKILLEHLQTHDIGLGGHPLVIINACKTGKFGPYNTSFFAAQFLRFGARGVVATECAVPDDFAADFARQLYSWLLDEKPLGASLLAARQYFLRTCGKPTGLLYSMYAPPSIRLVRTG